MIPVVIVLALLPQLAHGVVEARQGMKKLARPGLSQLVVALAMAATGCAEDPPSGFDYTRESQRLRGLTTPPTAQDVRAEPERRGVGSVASSWTFETPTPWPDYVVWVRRNIPELEEASGRPNVLVRRRAVGYDTLTLEIELLEAGSPCHVRVTFDALAG